MPLSLWNTSCWSSSNSTRVSHKTELPNNWHTASKATLRWNSAQILSFSEDLVAYHPSSWLVPPWKISQNAGLSIGALWDLSIYSFLLAPFASRTWKIVSGSVLRYYPSKLVLATCCCTSLVCFTLLVPYFLQLVHWCLFRSLCQHDILRHTT